MDELLAVPAAPTQGYAAGRGDFGNSPLILPLRRWVGMVTFAVPVDPT